MLIGPAASDLRTETFVCVIRCWNRTVSFVTPRIKRIASELKGFRIYAFRAGLARKIRIETKLILDGQNKILIELKLN